MATTAPTRDDTIRTQWYRARWDRCGNRDRTRRKGLNALNPPGSLHLGALGVSGRGGAGVHRGQQPGARPGSPDWPHGGHRGRPELPEAL